jgi:hypothetical protein
MPEYPVGIRRCLRLDHQEAYALCQQHMHRYVGVQMADGTHHDGIVETVDEHHLYLAVPIGAAASDQMRAFTPFGYAGYGYGYGYPGYGYPGYYPGYGYERRILPLAALLALSLLPYY